MSLDFSKCRMVPFDHQKVGIQKIVENPVFALFDEMGAGKTKQSIDAAQFLYDLGIITRVLVICPASVRNVWFDPELGELKKHLWDNTDGLIINFHARKLWWTHGKEVAPGRLQWRVINYEFIRSKDRLNEILQFCDAKTLLILDESSAVKNHKAQQTKSVLIIRRRCGRVLLLNGTPISNSPLDMYSQGLIMNPAILACQSYFHFRSRYAIMGGYMQKQIIGWQLLEDMQRRFAPFVIRRLKKDCLDLPEVLPAVTVTVTLTPDTWAIYKQERDEMVVFLEGERSRGVSVSAVAIVKAIRLRQIVSGYIGGVQDIEEEEEILDDDRPDWLPRSGQTVQGFNPTKLSKERTIRFLSREKIDAFDEWYTDRLAEDKNLKLIVWCAFRPELDRFMQHVVKTYPHVLLGYVHGGQKPADRSYAERLLDPRTAPPGPVLVGGTYGTGSLGLNLTAAHVYLNMSYDYSWYKFMQSQARVDRPGQVHAVSPYDMETRGPQGQKTIEHTIIKARRNKEDLANFTTSAWIAALKEE